MRSILALLLASQAAGDVYLHNPRGSNNRLNEANAVRNNGNRLFDSQNNNRGGYNVGERINTAFDATAPVSPDPDNLYDYNDVTSNKQYQMGYYEKSGLVVEWTNQHACGGSEGSDPQKVNCNIVIQYMCDTDFKAGVRSTDRAWTIALRDGANTNTPTEPNNYAETDPATDTDTDTGRNEPKAFYYECKKRLRNRGLFLADQRLNGLDATRTRQNPNGNRRGLECPEERDYFPYWWPSPWIDAGYLTDHVEHCPMIYAGSQNTAVTHKCMGRVENDQTTFITQAECEGATPPGTWVPYVKNLPPLRCTSAPWSRTNHLGNGADGQAQNWTWTLPDYQTLVNYGAKQYGANIKGLRCTMRLRYNISTDDYDPWNTFFPNNTLLENNPVVDVGTIPRQGLRLAINTNQFGRTFQDRGHVFYLIKRPAGWENTVVHNLNVRGKRGNIVQTFPSVEYDFIPNRLVVSTNDLIHIQWTGSNTHNNGGGGGDGQAGDDGQGQGGTDRNNFVSIMEYQSSYPVPVDKPAMDQFNLVKRSLCYDLRGSRLPSDWMDCAVILATSGYKRSRTADFSGFNPQMNNAPASLIGGVLLRAQAAGRYNYMSSRNNNFSNRGQKGFVLVQ